MRFLEEASQELAEAALWYESKEPGLGERFLAEVESTLVRIEGRPGIGARWELEGPPGLPEVRRLPLRRFPFLVVYAAVPGLMVVAVAHGRRRPGYWTSRLDDE
jgi:hypothetical protein